MTQPIEELAPRKAMSETEISDTITRILEAATLEEKVAMMSGHGWFQAMREDGGVWGARPYRAGGGCARLGVPAFYFTDGPRGVVRNHSTCFPCTMARGATFDPELEHRVGEAMGIEARAQDCNLLGAVCVNLLRHPAWGRAQETYGEDPFHLGEMGSALGRGIQTHNVCAAVKHFALNSMENVRFKVDVRVDDRTLREVYLPHFKRVLDAGIASVMSAYNKVNGEYCGQSHVLLTDILRGEWDFDGWVHSDWVHGVHAVYGASAGLDVENPEPLVWGDKLVAAVRHGAVAPFVVERACRRILSVLYRFAAAEDPLDAYPPELVSCSAHAALAREVAEKSAVLLHNEDMLPLDRQRLHRLAVLGRLAALPNTGDRGSSAVKPPYVITPLEGLRRYLGTDVELLTGDENDLRAAADQAARSDAVVVIAGYTADDEGEFIPDTRPASSGHAAGSTDTADTATQPANRGGDRESLHLPDMQVRLIEAHGYTLLERTETAPRFAFGHGLSYAVFSYRSLAVQKDAHGLIVAVAVRNDGCIAADEVVQVYIGFPNQVVERPRKLLRGFRRLHLAPGQSRTAIVRVPFEDLGYWDPRTRVWRIEPGDHRIFAGPSSAENDLMTTSVWI